MLKCQGWFVPPSYVIKTDMQSMIQWPVLPTAGVEIPSLMQIWIPQQCLETINWIWIGRAQRTPFSARS